jgi:hypothetical protein
MMTANSITPERLLLAAIMRTMSAKKRERVLQIVGETTADNVIKFHSPITSAERNELVGTARRIAGERD